MDAAERNAVAPVDTCDVAIGQKLDTGGFGVVYAGVLHGTREVAVKQFKQPDGDATETEYTTLIYWRELEAHATANGGAHVVNVVAYVEHSMWLIMDRVYGQPLFDIVHARTLEPVPWNWGRIRTVGIDVAHTLRDIHARGILHRDVKTRNVILEDSHGEDRERARLIDYGLSRTDYARENALPLTGGRGTPHYMAPEVYNHQPYGSPADVYAYGMMLWEMCTRRIPYATSPNAVVIGRCVVTRWRDARVPLDAPPEYARLVQRCLAINPDKRPSAAEICDIWAQGTVIPDAHAQRPVLRNARMDTP